MRIGPLTAKNRFFQVPHCNGMGYRDPSAEAAMRRAKAEGGWAVVCTEQVEIHPTSDITLMEAARELGGRVAKEARLPGLAAWIRVLDYRAQALADMKNVEVYRQNPVTAEDIAEFGFEHVAVATGSTWRRDGVARWHTTPIGIDPGAEILTPDDLMAGARPRGQRVVLFDDDHYYLGGVLAELLATDGHEVQLVTPASQVSAWTTNTLEITKVTAGSSKRA